MVADGARCGQVRGPHRTSHHRTFAPSHLAPSHRSPYGELSPRPADSLETAWRAWLQKHHASSTGVWLVFAKKHSRLPTVTYNDAVEEALCFGWIDGLMNPVDDTFYKQLFTPRKPKSGGPPRTRSASRS